MKTVGARAVLLISSPDEKGIVHKVTGVLYRRGLNIVENTEFVDPLSSTFFMRTEFDGAQVVEEFSKDLVQELKSQLSLDAQVRFKSLATTQKNRIVILATREAHCLGELLLRHEQGELNAEILGVLSQYEDLGALVRKFNLPFKCIPVQGDDRLAHEAAILKEILPKQADYLVLAKYMRVLSAEFISHFPERIINIHHSFLPAFVGKNPYAQAYERGVKIIGATAHFVNEVLDDGPIITQSVIPINHTQDARELARSGRDVEKAVLANALRLVFEDRVIVHGRRTLVFE